MKPSPFPLSKASIALLVFQFALVSSIAAKYLYQRQTNPRVWTRTAAIDPVLPMRGRYLSLSLMVDGCQSTLPSAKQAQFPRNVDGTPATDKFGVLGPAFPQFPAKLAVKENRLIAIRLTDPNIAQPGEMVVASPGSSCDQMRLWEPVNFYIPEHALDPTRLKPGQELWIEVTVPSQGPPRPIQLALKQNGLWRPLAFN